VRLGRQVSCQQQRHQQLVAATSAAVAAAEVGMAVGAAVAAAAAASGVWGPSHRDIPGADGRLTAAGLACEPLKIVIVVWLCVYACVGACCGERFNLSKFVQFSAGTTVASSGPLLSWPKYWGGCLVHWLAHTCGCWAVRKQCVRH
jgi:hypothetical protein